MIFNSFKYWKTSLVNKIDKFKHLFHKIKNLNFSIEDFKVDDKIINKKRIMKY